MREHDDAVTKITDRDRAMARETLPRLTYGHRESELALIIADARQRGVREGIAEERAQITVRKEKQFQSVFLQFTLGAFYEIRERHRRRKASALLALSNKEFAKRIATDEGKALLG